MLRRRCAAGSSTIATRLGRGLPVATPSLAAFSTTPPSFAFNSTCLSLCDATRVISKVGDEKLIETDILPWEEDFAQGVNTVQDLVEPIPMAKSVKALRGYLTRWAGFYVNGSPGCGKSSLMMALLEDIRKEPALYDTFVLDAKTEAMKEELVSKIRASKDRASRGEKKRLVVFIDEFQDYLETLQIGDVIDDGFKNSKTSFACFGTTAPNTNKPSASTPSELRHRKLWMYSPSLDRQEVKEYAARVLVHHKFSNANAQVLASQVFDFSCGSLNVMIYALKKVVESKGRFPQVPDILNDWTSAPRVVVNGNPNWSLDDEDSRARRIVAERLLETGSLKITADTDSKFRSLLRRGFLSPVRAQDSQDPLVPSQWGETLSWSHPWQPLYAQEEKHRQLIQTRKRTYLVSPFDALSSALKTVVYCASSLRVERVITDLMRDSKPREYDWHHVFNSAVSEVTGRNLQPEKSPNGPYNGEKYEKRLDFLLDLGNGNRVGFELMRDGLEHPGDVREHLERFGKTLDHQYSNALNLSDHIVVNFELSPIHRKTTTGKDKKINAVLNDQKVITVAPDLASGWGVINLYYLGKFARIPRNFVPHTVDWSTDSPTVEPAVQSSEEPLVLDQYWVSVALPGQDIPEVIDITPAVKHDKDISSNIFGLKKAVKKELALELQGKGISHLTVYPPRRKKDGQSAITKMNTALKSTTEDEPYHVEIEGDEEKDGQALDVGDALKSASRAEPYRVEVK